MMRGMAEQVVVDKMEDGDKEKKKRRRPHRRSKHNSSSQAVGYSSVNGIYGETTEWIGCAGSSNNVNVPMSSFQNCRLDNHASKDQVASKASNGGFSSLPTMHINGEAEDLGSPSLLKSTVFSKSCPVPIFHQETNGSFRNNICSIPQKNDCYDTQRKYFDPHWSVETVNKALQKGDVFKASFRVNAHNRIEAYCTIDGAPTDVLINGVAAQNRAVESDIVALKLDPVQVWTKMRGSAGHSNDSASSADSSTPSKNVEVVGDNCKGKGKVVGDSESSRHISSVSDSSNADCVDDGKEVSSSLGKLCAMMTSFPTKRPTGSVVAIIERSPRRKAVVGFLGLKQWEKCTRKSNNFGSLLHQEFIILTPNDAKFAKILVSVKSLPDILKTRLMDGDTTVAMELVAVRIDDWNEENPLPVGHVTHVFGRGGEIETQIAAILFEHDICRTDFSPDSLSCLPVLPWKVPIEELERRKDLRNVCTFTIDPPTASDLDDALSVERVSDGIFRVGVHIADASYFILPDTPLDIEAQTRSTSVYLRQHKLPMLPKLLAENFGSLIPGVDRLAFSMIFECNLAGDVVDRWIGRTVIRSCCKLSYQNAQDMIDGSLDVEGHSSSVSGCPELFGVFKWQDVIGSVKSLYEISKRLKENRFTDGAIHLDSLKIFFLFDECGIPYDSMLYEQIDSNSLVEEFMLLANRTAAEVICRAFPDCALLRRHPEPNARRLKDFEAFWRKHGIDLDTSSSGQLHLSLVKIKENLKNDPVLFDILVSYASKPMQLATYFCTGDFKERENEWGHYSLAVPLYTHFTSPLRRYPDIVVHRTLAAVIEAEDIFLRKLKLPPKANQREEIIRKCFTGLHYNKEICESKECREALSAAALKHRVLCTETLAEVVAYCNKRRLASRHAEDASEKLYLWVLLNKKETLIAEARVLGLGPKFMSIYIHKLAIERRIYYDEVEGLSAEWLETTSTLVLSLCASRRSHWRGSPGRHRALEDVALVINPCELKQEEDVSGSCGDEVAKTQGGKTSTIPEILGPSDNPGISNSSEIDPPVFPLTLKLLSTIHVALHAVGGDDGPLDIGARLYVSSYLC